MMKSIINSNNVNACGHPPYVTTSPVNNPLHKNGYSLVLNDEFQTSSLNCDKFSDSYGWARSIISNEELEWYSKGNNYSFLDSKINLIARKQTVYEKVIDALDSNYLLSDGKPNKRIFNYTSGAVSTNFQYLYGYFEIKCKIPAGKGLWPAFWLLGDGGEIDVFEFEGAHTNIIHTNWHTSSGQNPQPFQIIQSNYADGESYTYAVEWTPNLISWVLNNQTLRSINHSYINPMFVYLNLAVASAKVYDGPPVESATYFPASFEIDYIRVYQKDEDIDPVIIGNNMIKINNIEIYKSPYPALPHSWLCSSGLSFLSGQGTNVIRLKGIVDGSQMISVTVTTESGLKVTKTMNVYVVSTVPSKPKYIKGPNYITGTNIHGSIYDFPITNYSTDLKPDASYYNWSISPDNETAFLDPNGTINTYLSLEPWTNIPRTYTIQVQACNVWGCGFPYTKEVSCTYSSPVINKDTLEPKNCNRSFEASQESNSHLKYIQKEIVICPNPAKNIINIQMGRIDNYYIEVYDMTGNILILQHEYSTNFIINTEKLSDGLYIIKISNSCTFWKRKVQINNSH